jgi:hypothetical protein
MLAQLQGAHRGESHTEGVAVPRGITELLLRCKDTHSIARLRVQLAGN